MVKVRGPMLSLTARGWFGGDGYGRVGVLVWPYPIALSPKIHSPYRMPAWSLRPYPSFISQYYSAIGWCYQRRRTWHGCVWSAFRPPISENPKSPYQLERQHLFYSAVKAWQGLTPEQKDVYNKWTYPVHASGYNRFIRWFMKYQSAMPIYWGNLQRASDDPTLIEDAAVLQHSPHIHYPFQFYNLQAFNMVLHKGGGFPDSPSEGQLFYNESDDKVYVYKSPAGWTEIGAGSGTDTRVATVIWPQTAPETIRTYKMG